MNLETVLTRLYESAFVDGESSCTEFMQSGALASGGVEQELERLKREAVLEAVASLQLLAAKNNISTK